MSIGDVCFGSVCRVWVGPACELGLRVEKQIPLLRCGMTNGTFLRLAAEWEVKRIRLLRCAAELRAVRLR